MADVPRIVTVDEVRARGVSAEVCDADIIGAIIRSQEFVETFTRRRFTPVDLTIDMDGPGSDILSAGRNIFSSPFRSYPSAF